jgi:hypothetical protein
MLRTWGLPQRFARPLSVEQLRLDFAARATEVRSYIADDPSYHSDLKLSMCGDAQMVLSAGSLRGQSEMAPCLTDNFIAVPAKEACEFMAA